MKKLLIIRGKNANLKKIKIIGSKPRIKEIIFKNPIIVYAETDTPENLLKRVREIVERESRGDYKEVFVVYSGENTSFLKEGLQCESIDLSSVHII